MHAIVTRPAQDGLRWVRELAALGIRSTALPLIDIGPAADAQPVRQAWQQLASYQAAMFVSGNAVQHFYALNRPLAQSMPSQAAIKTRAWATGPGTVAALRQAGVEPAQIDAPDAAAGQFDSEALWHIVAPRVQPGSRVLIVRGGDHTGESAGRSWLAEQLAAAGAQVDTVVAYERRLPVFSAAQLAQAHQACTDGSVWLFSSSEAIAHLQTLLPGQDFRPARAVATHPRIAQAARAAGFGVVCESRPTLAEIVASIESLA
ncbi:uroporphyrinogen-III synthase [Rhodoferax ferrireducens]|uniref:Uroporphyrinogen-III synthase n=1 Tax=Rhodoferax ferrireducens TaxID=192843 RepID=A0ABU2C2L0_9BURK|nr:uroporphyrinogen-III synthase [Rhodoferax ferrireducens]MDR7375559.1 uroporphyrinogen-III synthase [Rhodoferax ferrireducens]